ncbi:MAG: type II toxin-antitoxin system VapC family toxin [Acidobacteriota bacterium]|nr:type II toxin-antitoxin system VapC family toxin [Acidobacteriota bacterium]
MIILDTNVISEIMKPAPLPEVRNWLASFVPGTLFTTTITLSEVLYGVQLVPKGRRRTVLEGAVDSMFRELKGHIMDFDEPAAHAFAHISAERRRLGRPIGELDAQIAAIALSHGAAIATRNVRDFADCGVELIDPWAS